MSDYFASNPVESLIAVGLLYMLIHRYGFFSLSKSAGRKAAGITFFSVLTLAIYYVLSENAHKSNESTPWVVIAGASIGIWVLAYGSLEMLKPNFKATISNSKFPYFGKNHDYQKVLNVDPSSIATFPRLTVLDLDTGDLIFDSSDFDVIRQSLGINEDLQPGFTLDGDFKLFKDDFVTKKMRVDYLNIFDDFSEMQTKIRSGEKVPYCIQITIYASKKHPSPSKPPEAL